jgi:hypothetical protein
VKVGKALIMIWGKPKNERIGIERGHLVKRQLEHPLACEGIDLRDDIVDSNRSIPTERDVGDVA